MLVSIYLAPGIFMATMNASYDVYNYSLSMRKLAWNEVPAST